MPGSWTSRQQRCQFRRILAHDRAGFLGMVIEGTHNAR
jgi:hypothetical protein